jgi:predicted RNA binding protein YcfA (HicA-like mRNA interferase family)
VKRRLLIAVLRRSGLVEKPLQGKGSHSWYEHPDDPAECTTVPDCDEIGRDLLLRILRQAGRTRDDYQARLQEL